MATEIRDRSPWFRSGTTIRLADGELWTFPDPAGDPWNWEPTDQEAYLNLLRVVREAEDAADRSRAELALAIFLLGCNYRLEPRDYQRLLTFPPRSSELQAAQAAFRELARRHLQANAPLPEDKAEFPIPPEPHLGPKRWSAWAWLLRPPRWLLLSSRKSQAVS